jgi:actin-related protein 8
LRIGLATDALPKTIPMVIARKASQAEDEEPNAEPRPKRVKMQDGTVESAGESAFGEDVRQLQPPVSNDD